MNNYSFVFILFKKIQKLLRGSGLGKHKFFREVRNFFYEIVRPKETEILIEVKNIKMYVDPSYSGVVPELLRDDTYEECETTLLQEILKDGDIFVDIGANIGYYVLFAAKKIGNNGKVFAFEPEPRNFYFLKKNVEINNLQNVILENKAISNQEGNLKLFIDKKNTGGHHLYDINDSSDFVNVETIVLDRYFENISTKIDLIKIDIEGYEPYVFKGMKTQIKKNSNLKILLEFCPSMLKQAETEPTDFLNEIKNFGFNLNIINEQISKKLEVADINSIMNYCKKFGSVNLFCVK